MKEKITIAGNKNHNTSNYERKTILENKFLTETSF
jgi:hypothetical protein